MHDKTIGIIGGFGAYATLGFQEKIFERFKGDSERSFPHIICDNNFKMPSRTKALLTGEDYDVIVRQIADSLSIMVNNDVDYIVLPCGTAHFFLEDAYRIVPEAKKRVVNIIDCMGTYLQSKGVNSVLVIAAEGTLKHHLYRRYFDKYNVSCIEPDENMYDEIRFFIECVKKNEFSNLKSISIRFADLLKCYRESEVVLGCTEFPVFISRLESYSSIRDILGYTVNFYDPLNCVIDRLRELIR